MKSFDKQAFEELMQRSLHLQRQGLHEEGLEANTEAYMLAPDNSFEKGRAARDSAARLNRLGRLDEAESRALESFTIHNTLFLEMGKNPSREAYRERSVSAMFVGIAGMHRAIRTKQNGEPVEDTKFIDYLRSTLEDLEQAKSQAESVNKIVDQYQINATRRVSMAESLFGERKSGAILGLRAVALAFMSESPLLDTTNPSLTFRERVSVRKHALLGGVAALAVNILAFSRKDKRQKLALKIADTII